MIRQLETLSKRTQESLVLLLSKFEIISKLLKHQLTVVNMLQAVLDPQW